MRTPMNSHKSALYKSVLYQYENTGHFARLANTLLKDEESARDNHVFARNFAKYSPIKNKFSLTDSAMNHS